MKIALTSNGSDLDAQVDPRFGRCPYFLIVETDTLAFEAIQNPNSARGGGAGIQSAQLLAEKDVKAVLTGSCGPNAFQTLQAAEVDVHTGVNGNVRTAIEDYKAGTLSTSAQANVGSHNGMIA
jgi:predicted Fe-Mo cluster-binding NifX family protein